jgi:GNAT superfamily N-acetyltransferase
MEYRSATIDDAAVLAEMNQLLIRDERHRNPMTLDELTERMSGWLQGEYQAIVFQLSPEIVGYALFRIDPDWVYLRHFFVQPQFRRRGFGRDAMNWLIANAWENQRRIRVEVLRENLVGIQFWQSLEFAEYCITLERQL